MLFCNSSFRLQWWLGHGKNCGSYAQTSVGKCYHEVWAGLTDEKGTKNDVEKNPYIVIKGYI